MELSRKEYEFYKTKAYFLAREVAPGYPTEDMIGWAMISLVKSLRGYKPDRQLTRHNYILQNMRWDMIDALRNMRLGSRRDTAAGVYYEEGPLEEAHHLSQEPTVDTDRLDLEKAVEKLPRKRRLLIETYFALGDLTLAAKAVGITTENAYQHQYQAVLSLRKLLGAPTKSLRPGPTKE